MLADYAACLGLRVAADEGDFPETVTGAIGHGDKGAAKVLEPHLAAQAGILHGLLPRTVETGRRPRQIASTHSLPTSLTIPLYTSLFNKEEKPSSYRHWSSSRQKTNSTNFTTAHALLPTGPSTTLADQSDGNN